MRFLDDRQIEALALDAQPALDAPVGVAHFGWIIGDDALAAFLEHKRQLGWIAGGELDLLPLLSAALVPDHGFVLTGGDAANLKTAFPVRPREIRIGSDEDDCPHLRMHV